MQAGHLVAVVFPRQLVEGGLNDASPQMKHQMQGGLSGYCILRKCNHPPAVCPQNSDAACQAGCPLDFTFDILSGVTGLVILGDGLLSGSFTKICISLFTGWLVRGLNYIN